MKISHTSNFRIGKYRVVGFMLVALLTFIGNANVSAQTQFAELTKVKSQKAGARAQRSSLSSALTTTR